MFGSKKTVEGIMAAFHKNIADLEQVQAANQAQAARIESYVAVMEADRAAALNEAANAAKVADKLRAIVS